MTPPRIQKNMDCLYINLYKESDVYNTWNLNALHLWTMLNYDILMPTSSYSEFISILQNRGNG